MVENITQTATNQNALLEVEE